MTSGDAGTKFFHAAATIRHRKNLVTFLEDSIGQLHSNHHVKASILWEAYKERLGQIEFEGMQLDLNEILIPTSDLSILEEPFSPEEIDNVVALLPGDKSPGPDGFNTDFIKRCWPIIKQDFYNLCNAFYEGDICLQSLNGSFITLIPKVYGPTKVNAFIPISLFNISMKIITKLLANRLQTTIQQLIHKNQYGFIQIRTIQDCLAWALEYLHMCHQSRKGMLILKLDFEKALDKVEHEEMLKIMQHKGFGGKMVREDETHLLHWHLFCTS